MSADLPAVRAVEEPAVTRQALFDLVRSIAEQFDLTARGLEPLVHLYATEPAPGEIRQVQLHPGQLAALATVAAASAHLATTLHREFPAWNQGGGSAP